MPAPISLSRFPPRTTEFSINMSNARFREPPFRRYVEEPVAGRDGPRGKDFNMRWVASMVADVFRIERVTGYHA